MRNLRALWMRLRRMFVAGRADTDFDAELESHLAIGTDEGVRSGLSADEARRQALIRLGGAEQARQAYHDRATLPPLESVLQDVRFALRQMRKAPGFTLTAVLTLALGIGSCAAIFSLVNAVLIRSLPYGDPERLVYLFTPDPHLKIPDEVICPSYGDFYDIRRESSSYEEMSNFEQVLFSVRQQGATERIGAARVDENFFATLESTPEIGRTITAEENEPSHAKVAVISHALWISMFGGRADVLERTIALDGSNYQIIGVMPTAFEYPWSSDLPYGNPHIKSTQVWVPLALTAKEKSVRDPGNNVSIARLRSGVSIHQAQAEMGSIMARLDKQHMGDPSEMGLLRNWGALIESFPAISIGPVRPLMRLLLAAVGLVLLIACGNAGNLLLARATERSRELGVRAALGAGRGRMLRQLLTESLLLAGGGCAVGIGFAFLFLRLLPRLDPGNIPRLNEASLDARVLMVALGASLLTSLITGALPMLIVSRMQLTDFLKSHAVRGRASGHSRLQSALIIAQTAMVVVLLAGAGLLIRSYINVVSLDTGFSQSTNTFHVSLDQRYGKPEQQVAFYKHLMASLEALPGVQAAGAVNDLPLSSSESISFLWVDGFPNQSYQQTEGRTVTPQYFAAMHIPLISGRYFTDADTEGQKPTIINEQFARTYFPNRSPIEGRISTDEKHADWSTVVGVVADVRHTSLEEEPQPQMYNASYDFRDASIAVRSTLPSANVMNEIRTTLGSIDPNLAVTDIRTMGDLVSLASARRRFQTSLLTAFAAVALLLALVGLYGLMSFSVNRRTREVGIRMALGAQREDVLLLVLRNAGTLISAGLLAGLACAWMTARLLQSFLFGVKGHDPLTALAVSLVLLVCGCLAALVPARRAATVDPVKALRAE
jgi:putative ABC transport system permease protein